MTSDSEMSTPLSGGPGRERTHKPLPHLQILGLALHRRQSGAAHIRDALRSTSQLHMYIVYAEATVSQGTHVKRMCEPLRPCAQGFKALGQSPCHHLSARRSHAWTIWLLMAWVEETGVVSQVHWVCESARARRWAA
jgi:hypothetical protein